MNVTVVKDIIRTIELNEEEAAYLAELTITYSLEGEESSEGTLIRKRLYTCATNNTAGKTYY